MCLIPLIRKAVSLPLIAAGGIGSGASMVAAMALGADGVQIGGVLLLLQNHRLIKILRTIYFMLKGDTQLMLKEITPVRLLKNEFYNQIVSSLR